MRTVTIQVKAYEYQDLSPNAKEEAKRNVFNILRDDPSPFDESITEYIKSLGFYDVKIHYSLGYSQGDGFCFEGKIDYNNLISIKDVKDKLAILPEDFLKSCDDCLDVINFVKNDYHYQHPNTIAMIIDNTEWCYINDYEEFRSIIKRWYNSICSRCETKGYKYFYEIDENEVIDYCNNNYIEFYSDGRLFNLNYDDIIVEPIKTV